MKLKDVESGKVFVTQAGAKFLKTPWECPNCKSDIFPKEN